ncbi:retrovirus-related pol polyprotein from transposon TNT 1-94 [Tanacetum coccineum]
MEAAVDQCSVDKNAFEIQIKQLSIDNDQLLKQIMSQEIVHITGNSVDILNVNKSCVDECNKCLELETELLKKKDLIEKDVYDKLLKSYSTLESISVENSDLNAQLQEKVFATTTLKNELRKLKRKNVIDTDVSKPSATIAPRMFMLDIEHISHRLKNNRDAHEELLVYVYKTCPSLTKPIEKLVAVTLINKDKKVRFVEHVTSSSNIPKQTGSLRTKDSNKPLLTSTGVNTLTSASGSKPSGNTKKIGSRDHQATIRRIKFTSTKVVPTKETSNKSVLTPTQEITVYSRRSKAPKLVVQIVMWYLDSRCSKHMTGNRSQVINFVSEFLGTVRFRKDHIAKIMGYGDYQMGNVTISWVYYVEELGVDLLKGSRGSNLYTLSMDNLLLSSPICLLSKASKTKSWLWHRRLSHLNFDYITSLAKHGLVQGLLKLKYQKDHLCSACDLGKSKKHSHKPKDEDSIQEKLYLLHMDLCGTMRIHNINGRKYIYWLLLMITLSLHG